MNTIALILVAVLAALPFLKKLFDQLDLGVADKQYDLLKKAVEDAVSHVSQVSSNEEMTSEEKKALAIEVGNKIASQMGVTEARRELVSDLIESTLWKDEVEDDEDEDEFDAI